MNCVSDAGVSRYKRTFDDFCFPRVLGTPRIVLTDEVVECLEPVTVLEVDRWGICGGDGVLAVSCSSMIFSRMRARFCLNASKSASSCFVTAMNRLLLSELCLNSTEVGDNGGVGCCDDLSDFTDEAVLETLF